MVAKWNANGMRAMGLGRFFAANLDDLTCNTPCNMPETSTGARWQAGDIRQLREPPF